MATPEELDAILDAAFALDAEILAKTQPSAALKFNPYHDPKDGKFTSGPGGSANPAVVAAGATANPLRVPDYDGRTFEYSEWKGSYGDDPFVQAHQPYLKALTDQQRWAVENYTEAGYMDINHAAANGAAGNVMLGPNMKERIAELDALLEKPVLGKDVILNRLMASKYFMQGVGVPEDFNPASLVGKVYTENAFSSTSMRPSWASSMGNSAIDGGVLLRIRAGKEMRGLRIAPISSNSGEGEVLLPRGATYIVRQARQSHGSDRDAPWYLSSRTKLVLDVDLIGYLPKKL